VSGPIPAWVLSALAAATLFTVMSSVGLGIALGDLRVVWQRPGLLLRGLLATLVAVPVIAVGITRTLGLPRPSEIGVVLMSIAPGAPLALRNALGAGGHRGFAPTLQIAVALLAAVSMPLSIAVLDRVYAGSAHITPWQVAKQVCVAQLVPLAIGIAVRRVREALALRLEQLLARLGNGLLLLLAAAAIVDVWDVIVAGLPGLAAAVVLTTGAALAVGHALGGPEASTRTAVAVTAATRNAGLALLVATLNAASPAIQGTVLAYIVYALPLILAYLVWRRVGARTASAA